jgi:O-antigen ligase
MAFFTEAPIMGHGIGETEELFRRSAVDRTGNGALSTRNPHNQTLSVAIQLGVTGVILLYAMWLAHLWSFRGIGNTSWIGSFVVLQSMIGSLFNSHLADFSQGWLYVIGVGVAGGMVSKSGKRPSPVTDAAATEPSTG